MLRRHLMPPEQIPPPACDLSPTAIGVTGIEERGLAVTTPPSPPSGHGLGDWGSPSQQSTKPWPVANREIPVIWLFGKTRGVSPQRLFFRIIFLAGLLHTFFFFLRGWFGQCSLGCVCPVVCAGHHPNPPHPSGRLPWSLRVGTCPLWLYNPLFSAASSPGLGPAGGIAAQEINTDRVQRSKYSSFKTFFSSFTTLFPTPTRSLASLGWELQMQPEPQQSASSLPFLFSPSSFLFSH